MLVGGYEDMPQQEHQRRGREGTKEEKCRWREVTKKKKKKNAQPLESISGIFPPSPLFLFNTLFCLSSLCMRGCLLKEFVGKDGGFRLTTPSVNPPTSLHSTADVHLQGTTSTSDREANFNTKMTSKWNIYVYIYISTFPYIYRFGFHWLKILTEKF